MLNATIEMFLSEYFLIKVVLGVYLEDGKKLFFSLSNAFLIDDADAQSLYDLTERKEVKGVSTAMEYTQHQRILKYCALTGMANTLDADCEEVIRIKGYAITLAESYKLMPDGVVTANDVYTRLSSAAMSGMVCALRVMGILQCEGVFLNRNVNSGIKKLTKAAEWNDVASTLALLNYCKEGRRVNMARLRCEVADTPFEGVFGLAVQRYGRATDDRGIEEVRLLNRAFDSGVLKREAYEPKYARILNSKILYFRDKERVAFSPNKEVVSAIGDLPLKLGCRGAAEVEEGALANLAIQRKEQNAAIIRALKNCDLRELPSYKPLCICSKSKYVLNAYAQAIAESCPKAHVEIIEVSELIEYDLEPTANNVFVRSLDEDCDNRLFLFFNGNIPERITDYVKGFLQSNKRAAFRLNHPGVTLNLSAVMPICFCDEKNLPLIKRYCEVVNIPAPADKEFALALADVLKNKEKDYCLKEIKFNGDLHEAFKGYDVDTAEQIIDAAVRACRNSGAEIVLSRDIVKEYAVEGRPSIGFGGNENGRK